MAFDLQENYMPMVKVMVNIIGWNRGLTRGFLFPLLQIFLDLSPGNVQLAGYMYICTRAMLAYLNVDYSGQE